MIGRIKMSLKKRNRKKKEKFLGVLKCYDHSLKEEFKDYEIEGYGILTINNLGTKIYTKTGKFPSLSLDGSGYLTFNIFPKIGGIKKSRTIRIHRLVASAFIPNPDNLPEVNHKDGNKLNNCVSNLEWVTGYENIHHAWENGLAKGAKGEENGRSKLTDEQVKEIRAEYVGAHGQIANLAKRYNVSWSLIKLIVTNKNWTHVK